MIKINLLAEAKPAKKKRGVSALGAAGRLNVVLLALLIGLALVAAGIEYLVRSKQLKDMNERIRIAQAEVTRLEAVLKEVNDYTEKKARLQKKVDLINQLKANQRGPVRLMDEISKALPDLLWIESMDYRGTAINVEGRALNPNAVGNFVENLKRVPTFQEPKVSDISACGSNTSLYCFRLSFGFSAIDKMLVDAPAPEASAPASGTPATKAELTFPGAGAAMAAIPHAGSAAVAGM